MCVCTHTPLCMSQDAYPCVCSAQSSQKDVTSPGAGVTEGCELPNVGAENQTQVFCKNSKCS